MARSISGSNRDAPATFRKNYERDKDTAAGFQRFAFNKLLSSMKNVLTFLLVVLATSAFGQSGIIRGKVIEAATGWEVIGATVQVEGAATGTVTDIDGTFSLKSDPGV